jgi:glycosyltransferase involved in cell wall biosynthesis
VRFLGFVKEHEKPAVYRGARAFIFPSIYEGFGYPPLEAISCGAPVVGSNASSLPEVVGSAGVLLEPQDAIGMAGALIQLLNDDAFHEDLQERAIRQSQCFSWTRTAEDTAAAFHEALA